MPKLYLITLDTCKHCHTFIDNTWPQLIPYIIELGYDIYHHDVQYSKQRQWSINNPHISHYITWYPTLIIIDNSKDTYRYEGDMEDIEQIQQWMKQHNI